MVSKWSTNSYKATMKESETRKASDMAEVIKSIPTDPSMKATGKMTEEMEEDERFITVETCTMEIGETTGAMVVACINTPTD